MAGKFTKVPQNTFEALQTDAGVLLTKFDPDVGTFDDADILCATTGGIQINCTADYIDYGEDVDNVPNNMMELKHLTGWTCSFSFTSLGTSPKLLQFSLGAADLSGDQVIPRATLKMTDFKTIWWVGDRADGGMIAVKLFNALSTDGISLQTQKNEKGRISVTMTGHVSITAQDVVPMEFYSKDAA